MGTSSSGLIGGKLTPADIERLRKRFHRLAAPGASTVHITKIQSFVEFGSNPFLPRIFQIFDGDRDDHLTVEEFTKALEYFGQLDDVEEQYRFAFRIYDVDGDGLVSSTELFNMLRMLMGTTYSEAQLEQVVHNTMSEYDRDGDNCLNAKEFRELLSGTDLVKKLGMAQAAQTTGGGEGQ